MSVPVVLVVCVGCGAKTELPLDERTTVPALQCLVEGSERECETICGTGTELCFDGEWQFCNAPLPRPPRLEAVVRDFRMNHPDFERPSMSSGRETEVEKGIVGFNLGPNDKPVYAATVSRTTTGAMNFNTWYNDMVPGVPAGVSTRLSTVIELMPSAEDPTLFVYQSSQFFPIDGQGFGNEGLPHNYHFTVEVTTAFRYVGGEVFRFTGDDDLWVFINRRLAIDLGGTHESATESANLDALAATLGLQLGEVYPLHLFFAERHTIASNFNIETTIAEFEFCE